jgi:beta-lactamase class D
MKIKKIILLTVLLLTAAASYARTSNSFDQKNEKVKVEDLSNYFAGFNGCFIIYNSSDGYTVYNKEKCVKRIAPCSTFKVINSLVGLETRVVADENTVFKWDGTKYPIEAWNKDLDMASAIKISAFWYYQLIAKGAGESQMQLYLNKLGYGNADISGGITMFWQQSSLKISPKEQVDILYNIYNYKAPFSKRNIDILKKIIRLDTKNNSILYGKTGSGYSAARFLPLPGDELVNGWFIGFVEKDNNAYFFAANIEAEKNAAGYKAKEITLNILKDKNIF